VTDIRHDLCENQENQIPTSSKNQKSYEIQRSQVQGHQIQRSQVQKNQKNQSQISN
jgi:hypothetical protein